MPISVIEKVVNLTKILGLLKKRLNKIGFIHYYEIIHIMLKKIRLSASWCNFYPRSMDFSKINYVIYYDYYWVIVILNATIFIIIKFFIYNLCYLWLWFISVTFILKMWLFLQL